MSPKEGRINARFVLRVRIIAVALVVVALLCVGRLYLLQIVHGEEYARRADAQQTVLKDPLLNRGKIYFTMSDGAPMLAAALEPVGDSGVDAGRNQRYYPGGSLAAQTLGFVAYNNDDTKKGRYGLERYYEETLGRSGEDLYRNFFVELFSSVSKTISGSPGQGDLITTLEPTVQAELERTLLQYYARWAPRLMGGIVMDPQTGEILAMAVHPTFDLNEFNKEEDPSIFGNPLVESVFEMGSIMKPLTLAAGLDAEVITEHSTYNDTGTLTLDGKKISNFDGRARGTVPVQQILNQSLNIGAAYVARALGPERMREYFLDRYKLGVESGIDLPSEVRGLTENLKSPRQVEYATASFGQGVAISPIAMTRALAVLANGGYVVTPHVVRAVREESGVMRELGWGEPKRVLGERAATAISRMLTNTVDEALAGGSIKLEHWSVAAKTGTAQMANPEGGGYYEDRFLHSFFGYFPSFNAKFLVFLFAQEPTGASFASQTWAGPFHELSQFLISYYDIPPDR